MRRDRRNCATECLGATHFHFDKYPNRAIPHDEVNFAERRSNVAIHIAQTGLLQIFARNQLAALPHQLRRRTRRVVTLRTVGDRFSSGWRRIDR